MSVENNNFMSMLKKNKLAISGIVVVVIIIGVVLIVRKSGSEEAFSTSDSKNIVENYPQSTPMNVMYSDSNGNLGTTTDLGLQNLTVASDSQFNGNTNTNGIVTGGKIVGKMGDSWGMLWGGEFAMIGKKGNPMRFGFADNTNADGWSEKVRIEPDGRLKIGNVYLSDAGDGTLRISNGFGYVDVGAKNGGWGHIYTDRPKFAFNAPVTAVHTYPYKDYAMYTSETSTKVQDGGNALMPSGMIMMWKGAVSEIPAGWVLCNGANGTPNLIDRFIVGAGSSYGVGATGGANEVTLSVDQMPKHQHDYIIGAVSWGLTNAPGRGATSGNGNNSKFTKTDRGPHDGSDGDRDYPPSGRDGGVGGGKPHENRPPYYALCYIMKV